MTRIVSILAAVLVSLTASGAALAASDAPSVRPCPPEVDSLVRSALRTTTAVTCYFVKGEPTTVNGVVTRDNFVVNYAQVALSDGRTVKVELTTADKANEAKADQLRVIESITYNHNDVSSSPSKAMAVLFWLCALASVGGALFVVTRRNLIAAVMGMVGSFLGIAAVYMMLYAQFLAVVQMLVYAGAIMVLFVFVVMILNRPEDEPVAPSGRAGQALGGVAILYLIGRLVMMLIQVTPPDPAVAMAAPVATNEGYDWGSVRAVGNDLFTGGLFPFEAISILLLLAVVGAIAIARPLHAEDDDPAKKRQGGVA